MITELGIVSGELLTVLEKTEVPLSVSDIHKQTKIPAEVIYMSLGWLVREGYVEVDYQDGEFYAIQQKSRV